MYTDRGRIGDRDDTYNYFLSLCHHNFFCPD